MTPRPVFFRRFSEQAGILWLSRTAAGFGVVWWALAMAAGCQKPAKVEPTEDEGSDSDPKLTARLLAANRERFWRDLTQFESLSLVEQERLIAFYDEMVALDPYERQRLWRGAEAFSIWLHALNEKDRTEFLAMTETADKLSFIRKRREEEWLSRLPREDQDRIRALEANKDERALLISRLKVEESERRSRSMENLLKPPPVPSGVAKGPGALPPLSGRPTKFEEMPPDIQKWIQAKLMPRLTPSELAMLKREDIQQWPNYPRTIYRYARDHFLLPNRPLDPILSYDQLPPFLKERFSKEKLDQVFRKKGLTPKTEQWPDFALSLATVLKEQKAPTAFLGPSQLNQLPKNWRFLVEKQLLPKLDLEGKDFLRRAEGKWPDYPRNLIDMMVIRGVPLPEGGLPGPMAIWRDAIPPH